MNGFHTLLGCSGFFSAAFRVRGEEGVQHISQRLEMYLFLSHHQRKMAKALMPVACQPFTLRLVLKGVGS